MKYRHAALVAAIAALCPLAHADVAMMVAVEPTSKQDSFTVSREALTGGVGKAVSQPVRVAYSEDLTDVMRATRTGEFDVYIAPPQVAASALSHGFEIVGNTEQAEKYVLVARPQYKTVADLKGRALYLPQQDSIYTYMARGLLNASGLSLRDLRVEHARWPAAGLVAVQLGLSDATVVRQSEWEAFSKANPNVANMLSTSAPVPGGLTVVVKKDLAARGNIAKWFATSGTSAGLKPVAARAEPTQYKTVAELGFFTPTLLPGATVVAAKDVKQLIADGAVMVDTRSEKEYVAKHVPKAILVSYHEKSLKDVAFDPSKDDFSGLAKLDKNKPTIFACNGAECWKSYKASKAAIAAGFKKVYWFRGGLPEWEAAGETVEKVEPAAPTKVATAG